MASGLRGSYSRALLKFAAAAVRSPEPSFCRPSLTKNSDWPASLAEAGLPAGAPAGSADRARKPPRPPSRRFFPPGAAAAALVALLLVGGGLEAPPPGRG